MRAAAVVLGLALLVARPARAFEEFQGTRAQGMGGATRAWALGDSGPLLNPAGMTLVKAYSVEASYDYATRLRTHFIHASIVDSTSDANISGGLYYTYRMDSPSGRPDGRGHEVGAALAMPLGSFVALGATLKWFHLSGFDQGPALSDGGFTFDAGATVRPSRNLSLAVVGQNLRDLDAGLAPMTLAYGVAFIPANELVLAVDGVTSFTRDDVLGHKGTGVQGGLEWTLAQRVAVRLGGGIDPMLGVGYLAGGVTALSEVGAVDVGVRGDAFPMKTGSERNVFLGASLRLFVPAGGPPAPTP
jgi:hypothetical protein